LNGSTCVPNFTKIHRSVQELLVGDTDSHTHTHTHTYTQTDRQSCDLVSPFSFLESGLKCVGSRETANCIQALGGVDWIRLAPDRDQWLAVVSAVVNLRVLAPRS
jgi:hypothetical protein